MKSFILIVCCFVFSAVAVAQNKIPVDSASKHIGESVTVCTTVYGVKSLEKLTFINVGAAYPNSPLTIVIFAKDLPNFKPTPEVLYANKKICVTGKVEDFKGKAEIVITKPEEIVIQ
jgi:DNA/RNA endonuclease YhcR with UshA esterase domain